MGLSRFEVTDAARDQLALALGLAGQPRSPRYVVGGITSATASAADGAAPLGPLQWFDTPHVPHGWDCGLLMESLTGTFFCGDLFTQPGFGEQALTEADILGPSEAFRQPMDYYAHAPHTVATLARLAQQKPRTLACMHGSAWRGDGGALLRHLGEALSAPR